MSDQTSPYQRIAVAETEAALAAGKKVILVAPTGYGKTVMVPLLPSTPPSSTAAFSFSHIGARSSTRRVASFTLMASGTA